MMLVAQIFMQTPRFIERVLEIESEWGTCRDEAGVDPTSKKHFGIRTMVLFPVDLIPGIIGGRILGIALSREVSARIIVGI